MIAADLTPLVSDETRSLPAETAGPVTAPDLRRRRLTNRDQLGSARSIPLMRFADGTVG